MVRVLIVDDQPPFRDAARLVVSMTDGFEVVGEAASGEESLTMAEQLHPDLVLMDVNLPGMSGLDATKAISERWGDIVVLIMSTYDEDVYGARALESGAAAYIPKSSFDPGRLADAWAAAGDGHAG